MRLYVAMVLYVSIPKNFNIYTKQSYEYKDIARKNIGPKEINSPLEMIFNPLCAPYYVLTSLRRVFPCNVVVKGESLADTPSFLLEVAIVFQNHSYFPFSWTFKIIRKLSTFIYHCMAGTV